MSSPVIHSPNKMFFFGRIIIAVIFLAGLVFVAKPVLASATMALAGQEEVKAALAYCEMQLSDAAMIPCVVIPLTGLDCKAHDDAIAKANKECMKYATEKGAEKQVKGLIDKNTREEWWSKLKDELRVTMAMAFKSSLRLFARQVAHDTAVWVASGGRGQKPLFITEGWGAYLQNIADVALGDFISQIGKSFGVDMCRPNLQVRLAIQIGLNYNQPRRVECSFSQMANNWQSAISKASFSVDYKTSLRPGENDISVALMLAGKRDAYVSTKVDTATKEGETNSLFKDIKSVAGKILTPGTMIANKLRKTEDTADIGMATFTNTIADIIEEFLNTLVAQLLLNLQNGFFSASGGSNGVTNPSQLSALFNPNASPLSGGLAGAKERFMNLLVEKTKTGGKYDILIKLAQCAEGDKTNPGPTDCVIDQKLLSAIKSEIFVGELSQEIKDRVFAPRVNVVASLENTIPYRSVVILRKYRIVPVGWELAGQAIQSRSDLRQYTLGEIIDCFYGRGINNCQTDDFKGMIDPYWVLKASELFCRNQGYGGKNSNGSDSAAISRVEYCADEQQCLSEDAKGNCQSYGYCSRERRTWNFGKDCSSRSNTCQTYKSSSGASASYLSNTLDFLNCSVENAGCRSYSTVYNTVSQEWNGDLILDENPAPPAPEKVYNHAPVDSVDGLTVTADSDPVWQVPENKTLSRNYQLQISSPCSSSTCSQISGCRFDNSVKTCIFDSATTPTTCSIPTDGISCYTEACFNPNENLLAGLNPKFDDSVPPNFGNAEYWTDELSFLDNNNRHYRADNRGKSDAGLRLAAANNSKELITTLDKIDVTPDTTYLLTYYIRGAISDGSVAVRVYASGSPLYGDRNNAVWLAGQPFLGNITGWTKMEVYFNSGKNNGVMLDIFTSAFSITDVTLDDFQLQAMKKDCIGNSVKLYSPLQTVAAADSASALPNNIYFDRAAQACSAASEGCNQFIRTKAGLGGNLIPNGGFDFGLAGWPAGSLALNAADNTATLGSTPADQTINLESGQYYAVAFDAGQITSGATVNLEMDFSTPVAASDPNCAKSNGDKTLTLQFAPNSTNLERHSCWFKMPAGDGILEYKLSASTASIKIDNIKLEQVSALNPAASAYTSYTPSLRPDNQLAYLKKAPDYLNCYDSNPGAAGTQWPQNAGELLDVLSRKSDYCSLFSGVCTPEEVGCELYTPVNGDPAVPGVANDLDTCPGQCVGYQIYKQEPTQFIKSTSTFRQFIADNKAKYCSAAYAGCDEFTNLDEIGRGGEAKEYYVRFSVCQKPAVGDGAAYYTWEGSDTTGYQLKSFNLKQSNIIEDQELTPPAGTAPCTNLKYYNSDDTPPSGKKDGDNYCDDPGSPYGSVGNTDYEKRYDVGICNKDDMLGNSDCREFYDAAGNIHYRLQSKTITVSDNCHPYRRTQTQLTAVEAENDCKASSGWWDSATTKACIYYAIPKEGRVCSAELAGCRAYVGNQGRNVMNILNVENFNSGTTTDIGWVDENDKKDGLFISLESTYPGGYSLTNVNSNHIIQREVNIIGNKTYTLSFWAKGNSDFYVDYIKFTNAPDSDQFAANRLAGGAMSVPRVLITTEWKKYDLGPVFTRDWVKDGEFLQFKLANNIDKIYLDNVLLKQLSNNVYAIENSWYTPLVCDNPWDDPDGKKSLAANTCQDVASGRCAVGEMLGCAAYKDRAKNSVYLRSFASLCRKEAAGCEALIDTHNSDSPFNQKFNSSDKIFDDVSVPADSQVYLVNDAKFACSSDNQGCRALGLPSVNKWEEITGYNTVYLKDNPNRYSIDLCNHNSLWCGEFTSDNSLAYFKAPHGKTCEFGQPSPFVEPGWYVSGTSDSCASTKLQTYGTGYENSDNKIQPLGPFNGISQDQNSAYSGWAGVCAPEQSGCAEYVDQLNIGNNEVPNFNCIGQLTCDINLKADALYAISSNITADITADAAGDCQVVIGASSPDNLGLLPGDFFYLGRTTGEADSCAVKITARTGNITAQDKIAKAGVYYKLDNSVDYGSCSGRADFQNGCVLFNNRGKVDYNALDKNTRYFKYLTYNAISFYQEGMQLNDLKKSILAFTGALSSWDITTPTNAVKNADSIIKVKADRVCSDWLYCTNYLKGNKASINRNFEVSDKCLGFDSCNETDDASGACSSFSSSSPAKIAHDKDNPFALANFTGYSIAGLSPFSRMAQAGSSAMIYNGDFEQVKSGTTEPIGWTVADSLKIVLKNNSGDYSTWSAERFASEYSTKNKLENRYLKVNSAYIAESDIIDVFANSEYILTGYLNTLALNPAGAKGEILVIEEDGQTGERFVNQVFLTGGLPWTKVALRFTTKSTTTQVRIRLENFLSDSDDLNCRQNNQKNVCGLNGYTLFDNINLSSSLKAVSRPPGEPEQTGDYIEPSCRVYPDADSPACAYFSGNNYLYGFYGYCLIRDPQNLASCLQWWPVDSIAGESPDNVSYYSGRVPLYYCLASHIDVDYDYASFTSPPILVAEGRGGLFKTQPPKCTTKTALEVFGKEMKREDLFNVKLDEESQSGRGSKCESAEQENLKPMSQANSFYPGLDTVFDLVYPSITKDNYYGWASKEAAVAEADNGANITYCAAFIEFDGPGDDAKAINVNVCAQDLKDARRTNTHQVIFYINTLSTNLYVPVCDMLTQTVTQTGRNKAWAKRVAAGSTFELPLLGTTYGSDYRPFGAILAPEPADYPENWGANQKAGVNSPLGHVIPISGTNVKTSIDEVDNIYTPTFDNGAARAGDVFSCWIYDDFSVGPLQLLQMFLQQNGFTNKVNTCQIVGRCQQSGSVCLSADSRQARAAAATTTKSIEEQDKTPGGAKGGAGFARLIGKIACIIFSFSQKCMNSVALVLSDVGRLIQQIKDGNWVEALFALLDILKGDIPATIGCVTQQIDVCSNGVVPTSIYPCPLAGEACVVTANRFGNYRGVQTNWLNTFLGKTGAELREIINRSRIPAAMVDAAFQGTRRVRQLFAKNYDVWVWTGLRYEKYGPENADYAFYHWNVPDTLCFANKRPVLVNENTDNDALNYCATAPIVSGIRVNGLSGFKMSGSIIDWLDGGGDPPRGSVSILPYQSIVLEFNVTADNDQLPITALKIDWGDGDVITYSDVSLRDKSNPNNKFKFYHYYNPQKLADLNRCAGGQSCSAVIKIQARDNWGWCNGNLDVDGLPLARRPFGYYSGNNSYACADRGDGYCDGKHAESADDYSVAVSDSVYDCDDSDAWTRFPGLVTIDYRANLPNYDCLAKCTTLSFSAACGQECKKGGNCCSDDCVRIHDAACGDRQVNIVGDGLCSEKDTMETINNSSDCQRVKANDLISLGLKNSEGKSVLLYAFLDDWNWGGVGASCNSRREHSCTPDDSMCQTGLICDSISCTCQSPLGPDDFYSPDNGEKIQLTTKDINGASNPRDFIILPQNDVYNPTPSGKKFSLTLADSTRTEFNTDGDTINNILKYGDEVYLHFERCENEYSGSQTISDNPPLYLKYLNGNWDATCEYTQGLDGLYYKIIGYNSNGREEMNPANIVYTQSAPQPALAAPDPPACSKYAAVNDTWVEIFSHNDCSDDPDSVKSQCKCTQYATCDNFFNYIGPHDFCTETADLSFCRDLVGDANISKYLVFKIVSAAVGAAAKSTGDVVEVGDAIQLKLAGYDSTGAGDVSYISPGDSCLTRIEKAPSNILGRCNDLLCCKNKVGNGYNIDLYPCTKLSDDLTCILGRSCPDFLTIYKTEDDSRATTMPSRW